MQHNSQNFKFVATRVLPLAAGAIAGAWILVGPSAFAVPSFLDAWRAEYPTSTLPAQMDQIAGIGSCAVCHHDPIFGDPGTCYRLDLRVRVQAGMSIEDALREVGPMDSDGDGVPNRVEFLLARTDAPGEIGYHGGLRGPTGNDPCFKPTMAVTNRNETPCLADFNRDATADFFDYLDFVAALDVESPGADVNGDSVIDFFDYLDFVAAFDVGC